MAPRGTASRTKPKLAIVAEAPPATEPRALAEGDVVALKSGGLGTMTIEGIYIGQDGRPWADLVFFDHTEGRPFNRDKLPLCFVCGPGHSDFDAWQAMVRNGLAKTRQGNAITGGENVFLLMLHAAESVLRKGETLDLTDFPKRLRAEDMEAAT